MVTTYASGETIRALATSGFRLVQVAHVFAAERGDVTPAAAPEGLSIEVLDRGDEERVAEAVRAVHLGYTGNEPDDEAFVLGRRPLVSEAVRAFVARLDGEIAGVGALRQFEGLGYLTFASTIETHRRKGVQSALIAARVDAAHEAGCSRLTVAGSPGETTERNATRLGFAPLCARLSFARPGPGLTPNKA